MSATYFDVEGFVKCRLMTQEPAFQCCVTATEIKPEIWDAEGRDSFYVFVSYVLPASIPLCEGPHAPLFMGPCVRHPVTYYRLMFLSAIP